MSNHTMTVLAPLPLLIANGSFKSLSHISEAELESFLSYLLNFLCVRDKEPIFRRPKWWVNQLPFTTSFALGSPLPYAKDKILHMKKMVRHVYGSRKSLDLLRMSQELAVLHSARLKCIHDETADTMTVFKDGIPLVIIPAQNFYYDLRGGGVRKPSSTLSSEVSIFKVRKESVPQVVDLVSDDEDAVIVNDSDDDCIFMGQIRLPSSPAKDKYLLPRRRIVAAKRSLPKRRKVEKNEIIVLSSDDEEEKAPPRRKNLSAPRRLFLPEEKPIDAHEFIQKENQLNLKLKEEEEKIKNQPIESFLQGFQLGRVDSKTKDAVETREIQQNATKNGKRWKKCIPDITSVPELVRRNYLSKSHLASKSFLDGYQEKIDEMTRTDGIESRIRQCYVSLESLTLKQIDQLLNKSRFCGK